MTGQGATDGKRLRVAHVLWSGGIGGGERSTRDLAAELDRDAFEAVFIFLSSGGAFADQIAALGWPTRVLGWRSGYSLSGRWRLLQALREWAPTIVHAHMLPPLTGVWMRLAAPRAPFVLSEHGNVELLVRQSPDSAAMRLNAMAYRRAQRVIVHSRHMTQVLARAYHVDPSKISLVHYGIDLREFDPRRVVGGDHTDISSPYRIGYVGRIYNVHKGVDYLIGLARDLLGQGLHDFEILIAGDGPDKVATERLCREMQVEHVVRFAGWQADVPAFLRSVDLLVVPSRFEPFGLVTVEALAMGVRVVAFDVGGIADAAEGCDDVTLVPAGDAAGLAAAVIDRVRRGGKSRSIESRHHVEQHFARVRMAREIEAIYRAAAV